MLIEIHMIQNHSPSNLNRDDLGAPKTCIFGGVTRARISSQCLKRSIRNPGNPNDIHNREPGVFAQTMAGNMGVRTKLFPWLVRQALVDSPIPQDEHRRIELAAQRIAQSSDKEEKGKRAGRDTDGRPKTPQLIHLGPGHAKAFVSKLVELREQREKEYAYFLHPEVGFREMVRQHPHVAVLDEKQQTRIVNASWVVAKCRMGALLQVEEGEEADPEPPTEDDQPGAAHADLVAARLADLRESDPERFKALVKAATEDEKEQLKGAAPDKPKKMDDFLAALKGWGHADAVDIALFGRMTTSDAFEDVEAAMQVAHAISTHEVVNEVDYFTAVDDLGQGPEAGHLGETQFNSACFYKYLCLDWKQLVANLAGDSQLAKRALRELVPATAFTTPTGKQNGFAEVKTKCPIPTSHANAFADPVPLKGQRPIIDESIARLGQHVHDIAEGYGIEAERFWFSPAGRHKLTHVADDKEGALLADARDLTTLDGLVTAMMQVVDDATAAAKEG
jgi:CRISPR system Cascade subunit CasC